MKNKCMLFICLLLAFALSLTACGTESASGFDSILFVSDGLAIVTRNNRRGIADMESGREVLPFGRYENLAFTRYDDFLLVRRNGVHGIIHIESGEHIVPFGTYQWIQPQFDSMAIASLDGEVAVISLENGEVLIPFGHFEHIQEVTGGMALVREREVISYCLHCTFNEIPCDPTCITLYHCYYYCNFYTNCHYLTIWHWQVVNAANGEILIPFRHYEQIHLLPDGKALVTLDDKIALIDIKSGHQHIPFGIFDDIQEIYNGMALVVLDSSVGVVSLEDTQQIIPFEKYSSIQFGFKKGIILVSNGWFRGLVCLETGIEILSPYRYHIIQALEDGLVTASTVSGDRYTHVYDVSTGERLHSFLITGGTRRTSTAYNSVIRLSGSMAVTHIIWDFGDGERLAEFELINLATNEVVTMLDSRSFNQIFGLVPLRSGEYPIYADGFLVIERETEQGRFARGLIETRTGEEIIPISENSPRNIWPLPGGFVAVRHIGGRWQIKNIESLRNN